MLILSQHRQSTTSEKYCFDTAVSCDDEHPQNWSLSLTDIGNLTYINELAATQYYFDADNRCTAYQVGGGGLNAYTYDSSGNLTGGGSFVYEYDYKNRMTRHTDGTTPREYTNYPDGTRASRTVDSGNEVKYLYDRENIAAEYEDISGTDTVKRRYTHGPGIDNPVRMFVELGATDKNFSYHANALGSPPLMTDDSQATAISYTYYPYGESTATVTDADASANRYRFTGREYETGYMNFYRSRYYNNRMGRFFSKDSWQGDFERPLSINKYLYVEGNPIGFDDPFGKSRCGNVPNPPPQASEENPGNNYMPPAEVVGWVNHGTTPSQPKGSRIFKLSTQWVRWRLDTFTKWYNCKWSFTLYFRNGGGSTTRELNLSCLLDYSGNHAEYVWNVYFPPNECVSELTGQNISAFRQMNIHVSCWAHYCNGGSPHAINAEVGSSWITNPVVWYFADDVIRNNLGSGIDNFGQPLIQQ